MTPFPPYLNLASLDYSLKAPPQPTTPPFSRLDLSHLPLPTPRTPHKPRRPQIRTEPPEPHTHANRHRRPPTSRATPLPVLRRAARARQARPRPAARRALLERHVVIALQRARGNRASRRAAEQRGGLAVLGLGSQRVVVVVGFGVEGGGGGGEHFGA